MLPDAGGSLTSRAHLGLHAFWGLPCRVGGSPPFKKRIYTLKVIEGTLTRSHSYNMLRYVHICRESRVTQISFKWKSEMDNNNNNDSKNTSRNHYPERLDLMCYSNGTSNWTAQEVIKLGSTSHPFHWQTWCQPDKGRALWEENRGFDGLWTASSIWIETDR